MIGYAYLHTAIDDHSRLAYTEILADERKETAAGFWRRAHTWFTACGITVQRVLTDNGSCYKSFLWRDTCAELGVAVKKTRPFRPQTKELASYCTSCRLCGVFWFGAAAADGGPDEVRSGFLVEAFAFVVERGAGE